jgi:hypothetical protein
VSIVANAVAPKSVETRFRRWLGVTRRTMCDDVYTCMLDFTEHEHLESANYSYSESSSKLTKAISIPTSQPEARQPFSEEVVVVVAGRA